MRCTGHARSCRSVRGSPELAFGKKWTTKPTSFSARPLTSPCWGASASRSSRPAYREPARLGRQPRPPTTVAPHRRVPAPTSHKRPASPVPALALASYTAFCGDPGGPKRWLYMLGNERGARDIGKGASITHAATHKKKFGTRSQAYRRHGHGTAISERVAKEKKLQSGKVGARDGPCVLRGCRGRLQGSTCKKKGERRQHTYTQSGLASLAPRSRRGPPKAQVVGGNGARSPDSRVPADASPASGSRPVVAGHAP